MKKIYMFLSVLNFILLLFSFASPLKKKAVLDEILIKDRSGKASISLSVKNSIPQIIMQNRKGTVTLAIAGGNISTVQLKNGNAVLGEFSANQKEAILSVSDLKSTNKAILQSGVDSGLYLKGNNKIVASLSLQGSDSASLGIGSSESLMTVLRGGSNAGLSFLDSKMDPLAAFGVIDNVPHMLISGQRKQEGLLLHGGKNMGMLFVDDGGDIQVMISKEGVFQGSPKKGERK